MTAPLHLYRISSGRRYWVIRPGPDGRFIEHFRRYHIAAIGHAEKVDFENILAGRSPDNGTTYALSDEEKQQIIESQYEIATADEEHSKSRAGNLSGQTKRFVNEIQVNDIVLTVTPHEVMAGRVLSDVYYDTSMMEIGDPQDPQHKTFCDYQLRRKVVWDRRFRRSSIPYILENSFKNTGTIFEVSGDNKVSILNHWLTPIHIEGETLHLSTRIERDNSIGNRPLTKFSTLLNELETASKNIADRITNGEDIDISKLTEYLSEPQGYTYVLTTQQAFMSPGDHFVQLKSNLLHLNIYAILFVALFQTNVALAEQKHELLTPQLQQKIATIGDGLRKNYNFDDTKEQLQLELKKQNDKVLDSKQDLEDLFPESEPSTNTPI